MSNGKGDADRTRNREAYRKGYEAINWHRGQPKFGPTQYAFKKIKPGDTFVIRHLHATQS